MAAHVSDWSAKEEENVRLDGLDLSAPGRGPLRKVMAAVKEAFDEGGGGGVPEVWVVNEIRRRVERASRDRETILYDDNNNPHHVVILPKFKLEDVGITPGSDDASWVQASHVHPAFVYHDGSGDPHEIPELYIGKYLAANDGSGKPITMPGLTPWVGVGSAALDFNAKCRGMNSGYETPEGNSYRDGLHWSLCTLPTYAAIRLMLSTEYGEAASEITGNVGDGSTEPPWRLGAPAGDTGMTLTGTGPTSWNPGGICDLVGNADEVVADATLWKAEVRVMRDNDALRWGIADSTRYIVKADGTLVKPSNTSSFTSGAMKFDGTGPAAETGDTEGLALTTVSPANASGAASNRYYCKFSELAPLSGVTVPTLMRALTLAPVAGLTQPGIIRVSTYGSKLSILVGGGKDAGAGAGIYNIRSTGFSGGFSAAGFRVVYMP